MHLAFSQVVATVTRLKGFSGGNVDNYQALVLVTCM